MEVPSLGTLQKSHCRMSEVGQAKGLRHSWKAGLIGETRLRGHTKIRRIARRLNRGSSGRSEHRPPMQMVCVAGGRTDVEKEETPLGITPNLPGIFVFQNCEAAPYLVCGPLGRGRPLCAQPEGTPPLRRAQNSPSAIGRWCSPKKAAPTKLGRQ